MACASCGVAVFPGGQQVEQQCGESMAIQYTRHVAITRAVPAAAAAMGEHDRERRGAWHRQPTGKLGVGRRHRDLQVSDIQIPLGLVGGGS